MSILNVNKINPVGSGSTVTIAGIASVTSSVIASSFVGNPLLLQTSGVDGNSERLRITSAGRIGIGTETPDSILAIEGTGSDNNTRITIKDGTGIAEVNGRYGNLVLDSDRDNAVNGSVMTFNIDGSEKVRINSSGRVGINSAIPTEAFEVRGNIFCRGATTSDKPKIKFGFTNGVIQGGKTEGNVGTDYLAISGNGGTNDDLIVSNAGYVTKPRNPVFHAFGGPTTVATNTDIVFGQERFDIGGGYNTSNGIYTAPVTGYYHFYAQLYRNSTENDAWWGFYFNGSQVGEARLQNNYGSDSGRGYATLQSSIYWYMTAGHKIKCRVGTAGAVHCNNTLSYFCGNLVG